MTHEEIRARFGADHTGKARCPAHDDRVSSLTVSNGADGRTLLHCHAGCATSAVVAAVGLKMSDLFAAPRGGHVGNAADNGHAGKAVSREKLRKTPVQYFATLKEARTVVDRLLAKQGGERATTWRYRDGAGRLVAAVVRYDLPTEEGNRQAKTFRPLAQWPDGWAIGDPAGDWPLYNLPDLAEARRVYVVEGEKCADALIKLGMTATTSAHGAKSPRKTDWAPLAGKAVTLLPDSDAAGRKYADEVTTILRGLTPPALVKVVTLPGLAEHGDAFDWLAAGGTGGELEALADAAPDAAPESRDVRDAQGRTQGGGAPLFANGTSLVCEPSGRGKWRASFHGTDGTVLHLDVLDPISASQRERFIKKAVAEGAEGEDVRTALLALASRPAQPETATTGGDELDLSLVARPEMFHVAGVSGVKVAVVRLVDNAPVGRWELYLRWEDGRRSCQVLEGAVALPGDRTLWFTHVPAAPSNVARPDWSLAAREAWLAGGQVASPVDVYRRMCQAFSRYLDFPADRAEGTIATLALWTLMTYVYPALPAVPYLFVHGTGSSGKSTVFTVLSRLAFRVLSTSSMSASSLFRSLHDNGGTVLFDEAETLKQPTPENSELRNMLLMGYKKGGQATRTEAVNDGFRVVHFQVYGPKALACIAGLPETLSSRCIHVRMFRAPPGSRKPRRLIDDRPERWQGLRDDLHQLALEHGAIWRGLSRRDNVCPAEISGRDYELWQPLLALASWLEEQGEAGLLSRMQGHAATSIEAAKDDAIPDSDEVLLEQLTLLTKAGEKASPATLLKRAQIADENTFAKWAPRTVTNRLKVYGIDSRKSNGRRVINVALADLERVQRHYSIDLNIPPPPPPTIRPSLAPLDDENGPEGEQPCQ